jgi:hypothetical protein
VTWQLTSAHGKSKATLEAALNEAPERVRFTDPAVFGPKGGGAFSGAEILPGERETVVLDPKTRRRFAQIERDAKGAFRVK